MDSNDPDSNPFDSPGDEFSASKTYAMSGRIMLSAIVILLFVILTMIILHLYVRWYLIRSRRNHIRHRSRNYRLNLVFHTVDPATAASAITTRRLDPNILKSLPVFTFSEQTHKDPMECAVCLLEFEEGELGRVLPNCNHAYHVDCIDMWFKSHSNCPICRRIVEPLPGNEVSTAEEHVIAIPPEPVSAIEQGSTSGLNQETRGSGSTDDSGRKPAAIEVSRRNLSELEDELTRNSSASHSFRSPMSRVLSFTRMLSRDRRSGSSDGAPPLSPSICRVQRTESDIQRGGGGEGTR